MRRPSLASLFINDLFWTLQGEGQHWGRRALFVRMPHCNLSCSWCDTTFDTHKKWSFEEFETFALQEKARFAVVTGGEPLMHKHTPAVVRLLQKNGFYVACETNGTFAPNAAFDWITCSPCQSSHAGLPRPRAARPGYAPWPGATCGNVKFLRLYV